MQFKSYKTDYFRITLLLQRKMLWRHFLKKSVVLNSNLLKINPIKNPNHSSRVTSFYSTGMLRTIVRLVTCLPARAVGYFSKEVIILYINTDYYYLLLVHLYHGNAQTESGRGV